MVLRLRSALQLTDQQFFTLCQVNRDLRIERTSVGDLIIMPPTGGETGNRSALINYLLTRWALSEGSGVTFDSSTGFRLPDGAIFSPDAAWVRRDRLSALSMEQKQRFLPLCPEFVIELLSPSDILADLQAKMQEYLQNGTELGWLIIPQSRQVYVYQPDVPVQRLEGRSSLSGDPLLPGLIMDLSVIWEVSF